MRKANGMGVIRETKQELAMKRVLSLSAEKRRVGQKVIFWFRFFVVETRFSRQNVKTQNLKLRLESWN